MRLSDVQIELRDTLRAFLTEHVTGEYLRSRQEKNVRYDPNLIASLKELGLDEGFGGEDPLFGTQELGVFAHEAGRSLLPEPVIEELLVTQLFPTLASSAGRKVIQEFSKGAGILVALRGTSSLAIGTKSDAVTGSIEWCYGRKDASHLIAFTQGKVVKGKSEPPRVVLVDLSKKGAHVEQCESLDLTVSLCRVRLKNAPAEVLSPEDSILLDSLLEFTKACELSGVSARAIEMTVEYVKTREQFGVPVGGFQAVQQQLSESYAKSEALGALSRFAAWAASMSPEQRVLTARSAAIYAASVAPLVCEKSIQCHGGIGFTWEYDLHLYLRRARLIASALSADSEREGELLDVARGSVALA